MRAKIIALALFFVSIACLSYAGEGSVVPSDLREALRKESRAILPIDLIGKENFIISEMDKKNALQILSGAIKEVKYNKDGTIDSVLYSDGTIAKYKNSFDEHGKFISCSITIGNIKIVFKKAVGIDTDKDGKDRPLYLFVEVYNGDKKDGDARDDAKRDPGIYADSGRNRPRHTLPREVEMDEPMEKPVVVYCPATNSSLEEIARKPIQFAVADIKDAVSKAAALKSDAFKEYIRNTAEYYNNMERELEQRGLLSTKQDGAAEVQRRQAVDRAVEDVYQSADRRAEIAGYDKLITLEKGLRGKLLIKAREIYDNKVKEAQDYIDSMIDKLIGSKLAIYLNVKKDKMDALINLSEDKK